MNVPAPDDPHRGQLLLNKYKVIEPIGDPGGMGHVYRGENVHANVPVAVKILKPELQSDETLVKRFLGEGGLGLNHPNIVKILFVQDRLVPSYIVMEFLDGVSLARRIAGEGALPERDCILIFSQVLDALEYLHRQGVLHRDIKPNNVMLVGSEPGSCRVRLIDFGIAKRRAGTGGEDLTRIDPRPLLTPQYAPPEQFGSLASVTGRSDLYSTAVSLYEALCGALPYDLDGEEGLSRDTIRRRYAEAHRSGAFPPVGRRRRGLSPDWDGIFRRALDPDPARRYPDAAAFRADLAKVRPGWLRILAWFGRGRTGRGG